MSPLIPHNHSHSHCPRCQSDRIYRHGKTSAGHAVIAASPRPP
ncbi:IS1 family transposase [Aeromonas media]